MRKFRVSVLFITAFISASLAAIFWAEEESAAKQAQRTTGNRTVFSDWRADRPGLRHRITLEDLPPPYTTQSASNNPREVKRPAAAKLSVPDGFTVSLFAEGLDQPRTLRVAPNGDIFVAETAPGNVRSLEAERRWKLRGKDHHICARPFYPIRHRFLPGRTRPQVGLCRGRKPRHPLCVFKRRSRAPIRA